MTSPSSPRQRYQHDLEHEGLVPDAAQAHAVELLQELYDELLARRADESGLWNRLIRFLRNRRDPVKGLYFWGGVGRGKTYLMDVFYESLPFENKMRTHFHRFMQRVHQELTQLKQTRNPLETVAARIADEASVLCFDEFYVSDIGDAMILGGLLEHLMEAGVTLVATSNIVPNRLYENGLQRDRFLPAIALLNRRTTVVELDGGVDYRLRSLEQASLYYTPLTDEAEDALWKRFRSLVPARARADSEAEGGSDEGIMILNRVIRYRHCADDVIWFDFDQLCGDGRSANDYVELAKLYHAVLLSKVPQLGADQDDQVRRLINLVDELYDRNVKLIVSAEAGVDSLYTGTRLGFAFARTRSRLLEMQSHDYLAREHKPS